MYVVQLKMKVNHIFCVRPWSDTNKSAGDSLSEADSSTLTCTAHTVTDSDATRPVVFKRKLHLEIVEMENHAEKTN